MRNSPGPGCEPLAGFYDCAYDCCSWLLFAELADVFIICSRFISSKLSLFLASFEVFTAEAAAFYCLSAAGSI